MNRDDHARPPQPRVEKYANLGYVLSNEEVLGAGKWLVWDTHHDGIGLVLSLCPIDFDTDGEPHYHPTIRPTKVYNLPSLEVFDTTEMPNLKWFLFHEQMVRKSHDPDARFERIPKEGLGEIISVDYTHSEELSSDNPLRNMQYWNAPGGENLSMIHAAEWIQVHLKHCQDERYCVENELSAPGMAEFIFWQRERRRLRIEQGLVGKQADHVSPKGSLSNAALLALEVHWWRQAMAVGAIQTAPPQVSRDFGAEEVFEKLNAAREATDKRDAITKLMAAAILVDR